MTYESILEFVKEYIGEDNINFENALDDLCYLCDVENEYNS